ncbi:MAG: diguanylate cyclase [Actinobacteria bacterium]|nr:diguanylate cyclase [Actinomycetota bacterium]
MTVPVPPLCGVVDVTLEGTIVSVSQTLLELVDRTADDLVGEPLSVLLETRLPLTGSDYVPSDAVLRSRTGTIHPVVVGMLPQRGEHASIAVFDVGPASPFERGFATATGRGSRGQERLQILLGASVGFAGAHDELAASELLADVAKSAFRASHVSVHLRTDDELVRVAGESPLTPFWPEGYQPTGARTLVGGEVIVVNTAADARRFVPEVPMDEVFRKAGIHAAIAAPIIHDGGAIGSFICYFDHPRTFDDEAVPLAEALAGQAGQAIRRIRLEATLRRASMIDAITGLPSRRLFEEEAMQSLSIDAPAVCVLFIDLDGFKAVNDTLGHSAGDVLLGQVGQRLRSMVREGDTIGRFGGDEFIAVAAVRDESEARMLAERIRAGIEQPFAAIPATLTVTASIGLVVAYADAGRAFTLDLLIRAADHAMYEAKASGGNRVSAGPY